jgi:sugar/nucleoside kinase (ribokinase family)
MSECRRILVSGNTTMDIVTISNQPYNPSGKRPVAEYKQVPGGQAANVADLLAHLGHDVSFVGAFGNDPSARAVMETFQQAGIEISHSAFCEAPHHLGFVRVDQVNQGERLIDMYRDPELHCSGLDLDEAWVAGFDCAYVDNHEPELAKRLATIAQANGVTVVADLEEINDHTDALLPEIDVLIAPAKIITALIGSDTLEATMNHLLGRGMAAVIATRGSEGSIGLSRGLINPIRIPGIPLSATDTTGAGDAFHAAFVHAMLDGHPLKDCMNIANTIAAEKCRHPGPRIPAATARLLKPSRSPTVYTKSNWQRHVTSHPTG